jgi:hypothetical protein
MDPAAGLAGLCPLDNVDMVADARAFALQLWKGIQADDDTCESKQASYDAEDSAAVLALPQGMLHWPSPHVMVREELFSIQELQKEYFVAHLPSRPAYRDVSRAYLLLGQLRSTMRHGLAHASEQSEWAVLLMESGAVHALNMSAPESLFRGTLLEGYACMRHDGGVEFQAHDLVAIAGDNRVHVMPFAESRALLKVLVTSHLRDVQCQCSIQTQALSPVQEKSSAKRSLEEATAESPGSSTDTNASVTMNLALTHVEYLPQRERAFRGPTLFIYAQRTLHIPKRIRGLTFWTPQPLLWLGVVNAHALKDVIGPVPKKAVPLRLCVRGDTGTRIPGMPKNWRLSSDFPLVFLPPPQESDPAPDFGAAAVQSDVVEELLATAPAVAAFTIEVHRATQKEKRALQDARALLPSIDSKHLIACSYVPGSLMKRKRPATPSDVRFQVQALEDNIRAQDLDAVFPVAKPRDADTDEEAMMPL